MGKSRLALESISQLEPLWHVGFLSTHKLDVPDALSHWSPIQPTVIVIDYVPQYSDQIANWIDHFILHQDDYDFPVRLLILEREYKSQSWWTELTAGSSSALCRKSALFQNTGGLPLELMPLNQNEQYQVVKSFLSSLHAQEKLPDAANSIWQLINKLSVQGNPLFLGLVAVALANNSPSKIRRWQHKDLLDEIVNREKKAWERQLRNCDSQQKTHVEDLLCFSSIMSGFNWDDDEAAISHAMEQSKLVSSAQELALLWDKVKTLAGHDGGFIQPDLIAEYIILEHWPLNKSGPNQQIKAIFIAAYNSSFTIISQKTKPHAYKTSYSLF